MRRSRFLVAYDVRDPVRLRKVHRVVKGFGFPMQYSVFVCDLNASERLQFIEKVSAVADTSHDSIAVVDLGDPDDPRPFTFLGPSESLPRAGYRII